LTGAKFDRRQTGAELIEQLGSRVEMDPNVKTAITNVIVTGMLHAHFRAYAQVVFDDMRCHRNKRLLKKPAPIARTVLATHMAGALAACEYDTAAHRI
jgi:hypothetical protein